jgi:hypothetical protein
VGPGRGAGRVAVSQVERAALGGCVAGPPEGARSVMRCHGSGGPFQTLASNWLPTYAHLRTSRVVPALSASRRRAGRPGARACTARTAHRRVRPAWSVPGQHPPCGVTTRVRRRRPSQTRSCPRPVGTGGNCGVLRGRAGLTSARNRAPLSGVLSPVGWRTADAWHPGSQGLIQADISGTTRQILASEQGRCSVCPSAKT